MKRLLYKTLRGTKDILPEESFLWRSLEKKAERLFSLYHYREIRTPILEDLNLFVHSIGENTDIVKKEMFAFRDKGGGEVCLRPEATASCVRAYLENGIFLTEPVSKFYYIGPMFRRERPQRGRLRQFHQIGVEVMGSYSYFVDAEVILLLINLVMEFGLKRYSLKINTLGCIKDKKEIVEKYRSLFSKDKEKLCPLCKERYSHNVLRIFDCKETNCQKLVKGFPPPLELACRDCKKHFTDLLELLKSYGIDYQIDPYIVRGLDYYTRTVFELISEDLGAQDALGAGGRYDNLIEMLGGPPRGAVGFALGMERVILALKKSGVLEEEGIVPDVFLVTLGNLARREGFLFNAELRKRGIVSDIDYSESSLKAMLRRADKMGVRFVIIIGEEEIKRGEYLLRDMETSEQVSIKKEKIIEELHRRLNSE